jgi:nucleoid-associated protein YgaU
MLSRKDVKIGVAIGGILLAVVFVYMLSSPGSKQVELAKSDNSDQSKSQLTDVTTPPPSAPSDAEAPHDASPDASHGSDNGSAQKTADNSSSNSQTQGGGAAPAPESVPAGATAVSSPPAGASDPWESALRTGKLPAMMTSTPTAPPSDAAAPSVEPTPAPSPNVAEPSAPQTAPSQSPKSDAGKQVAAVPQDLPTTQPGSTHADNGNVASVHVVQMNETYCTIARSTWGRASLYQKLIDANPGIDPRHLHPGMKINIPALKLADATPSIAPGTVNDSSPDRSQGDGFAPGEAAGGGVITPNPVRAAGVQNQAATPSAANSQENSTPNKGSVPAAAATSVQLSAAPPAPPPAAPASVAARTEVSADMSVSGLSSDGTTYTVQSGDSLYKIAKRLYGTGNGVVKLYNANKDVIGPNMAKLSVGMVLKLPEAPIKLARAS